MIADVDSFKFLVKTCGHDVLIELFEMGALEVQFFDNVTGVRTFDAGFPTERHDLVTFGGNQIKFPHVARSLFEEMVGPSGKGFSQLMRRFSKYVSRWEYTAPTLTEALADIGDKAYINSAVRSLLAYLAPEYRAPDPTIFDVTFDSDTMVHVATNIDFEAATAAYHQRVPAESSPLSVATILAHVSDTRRDIDVASRHSSDMALAPIRSVLGACKFAEVLRHCERKLQALDLFQEVVFEDSRSIREAVNSGERAFCDVLRLVQQANKFKEWLGNQADSDDLRDAYCKEVSRLDWAEKLPPKAVRWLIVTGAGLAVDAVAGGHVGSAGSLVLSAADALLLDRFMKGWRPNQFVEGPLREFLRLD